MLHCSRKCLHFAAQHTYVFSCLQNRNGGSVVPMVQWPDKSLSVGVVQALSWRRSGLMLQPATQIRQAASTMHACHS